jgi:hypothetical protein
MFPPDTNSSIPPNPIMPYNSSAYTDSATPPNTPEIYLVTMNGVAASATVSISTYSQVSPYNGGNSNLGYYSVIFFYNSTNKVPGSNIPYGPGTHTTIITPNSLISSGATNAAIGTPLYILYYSELTYTNGSGSITTYTLPPQFNPGVGSPANPGGLQLGYIFTILPCSQPTNVSTSGGIQNNQITLTWSAPSDNGGGSLGNITSYIVQYNTTGYAPWIQVNTPSPSTNYTLSELTNGTRYYFQVAAVNGYCNNGGPTSGPFSTTFSGFSATTPDVPTGLSAQPGLNSVNLSWDAPRSDGGTPITSYTVQGRVSGTSQWYSVTTIPSTISGSTLNCVVTQINSSSSSLSNGTLYDFQVAAANVFGPGQYSRPATSSTYNVPDVPTILSAQPGLNSINLSWDAPRSDGGTPITSYTVQGRVSGTNPISQWYNVTTVSPISGSTLNCVVVTQINSNPVISFSNGTLYDFQVIAVNVVGPGQPSTPATSSTYNVPNVPTDLLAQPGLNSVNLFNLSWNAPTSDGGSPITSYTVQGRVSGTNPISPWYSVTTVSPISGSTLNCVVVTQINSNPVISFSNGTLYDFQVIAVNVVGPGQPSTPATASTYNVPDTPTGLSAQPGLNSVNLSWNAPSDGGTPITSYTVQGRVSGTNPTSQWYSVTTIPSPISGSTINCVVTNIDTIPLSNGTLYDFQVAAVNVVGPGQYSAPARESTFNVPDSPTGLIAQSGVRIVTLSWNPPASDGGTPIISYTVQHRPSALPNQSWITTPNANPIVLPPLNYNDPVTLQYIVTGLNNATQYDFQVTAVNASGTCLPSAIATASTYAAPGAPTGLTAQSGVKSVSLTWLPPLSDGGTPITSYTVRVNGITANTIPTSIPLTPVPLHCIVNGFVIDPNNPDVFQILKDGTLYNFDIAAVNAVDIGAYASITKSTDALPDAPISLMGTPCDAKVILYWTAPTTDGGAPITAYLVEFKLATSAAWSPFGHAPSTARTIVVTGLTNGSFYDFRVSAITAVGTGLPSNTFRTMPTEKFVPGPPPWSRAGGNNCPNCDSNYGASACGNAIPPYSTYALDERRKAEILKYNGNSAQMSKAQQYSMASRNALTRKKSWATQTQTYTNPNVDNLPESQIPINGVLRTVSLQCRNQPAIRCSLTSGSDVPGPVIALCFNAQIPLYNYKPQMTYPSGGEKPFYKLM